MAHPVPHTSTAAIRNRSANHEAAKGSLAAQEIFEGLSLLLTIDETLQLHRYLRYRSEEEVRSQAEQCHRSSASLVNSQRSSRSSLMTRFSRMSLASSTSTASHEFTSSPAHSSNKPAVDLSSLQRTDDSGYAYPSPAADTRMVEGNASHSLLLGLASPSVGLGAGHGLPDGPAVVHEVATPPANGVTFPSHNAEMPYQQPLQASLSNNVCYGCNVSCKNATTLAKHQNEFCERKVEWFCPVCHKVFGLQERLNRHHMETHADDCTYSCDKIQKLHREECKLQLSKCSLDIATKKAWGCPCCVKCFGSLAEWSHHISSHPVQNQKVQNWSFSTMIWSLLKQPYLSDHVAWKQWQACTWSTLRKDVSQSLRHALERQEVPAPVMAHKEYCGLDGPAALAKYAFNLGTTGEAHPRDCKTPKMKKVSSPHSSALSSRSVNGLKDSPQSRSAMDEAAQYPATWPLPTEAATCTGNTSNESDAPSSFRGRVLGQANHRQSHGSQELANQNQSHASRLEDAAPPPNFYQYGETGYHHVNRTDDRQMIRPFTIDPPYLTYPPVMSQEGSAPAVSSEPQVNHRTKPIRLLHEPNDSESRRLQTKKSQANLHGRFAYSRDPALYDDDVPPLPTLCQDAEMFNLDNSSRGMHSSGPLSRCQTASSRPVTPARSEISQGSWTKLLNTSSPCLPSTRYSVAMSLSGPPSDVDMGWY